MGRFLSRVRMILVVVLVCFAGTSIALANTLLPAYGEVKLNFRVPGKIDLKFDRDWIDDFKWDYEDDQSIEGRGGLGPSMVGAVMIINHLTVHSNVDNWNVHLEFDDGDSRFFDLGGIAIVKLTHNVEGRPGESFSNIDNSERSYNASPFGRGTTTFDTEYYVVAPLNSQVDIGQEYELKITYTVFVE